MAAGIDWLYCIVMGLVEGLTEFLPISSTGHLIVTTSLFGRDDKAFTIAIQIGAISAILFLYRGRLWSAARAMFGASDASGQDGRINLLWLILLAAIPPAVLGLLLEDRIDELLFNNLTVGIALIVGGVLLIALEAWCRGKGRREADTRPMEAMSIRQAIGIGLFQSLALIPGTSRSGATIAGAMLLGFKRTAAAEFSFLVGLPILYGASLLKLWKNRELLTDDVRLAEFGIGTVVSFVAAALVVGPFVRFLQRHDFVPFGWYRIVAGAVILLWFRDDPAGA